MADTVFDPRCLRLLTLLKQQEAARAEELVTRCINERSPEWVYLSLLLPAVFLTGEMFVAGDMDQPQMTHNIGEIRRLMALAQAALPRRPRLNRRIFASFMPGDIQSIGFVAISHWLDRDGWDVIQPWPVPKEPELVQQILNSNAHAIALSCSLPRHVVSARRIIRALKDAGLTTPIWLGGLPINVVPGLFERTGADHTARDIAGFTRELATRFHYETATPAWCKSFGET